MWKTDNRQPQNKTSSRAEELPLRILYTNQNLTHG